MEFRKFILPSAVAFDSADEHKFTSGRPCVQETELAELFFRQLPPGTRRLPVEASLLELHGDVVFSAWKRAETADEPVLRFYNPDFRESVTAELDPRYRWTRCNLAEIGNRKLTKNTWKLRPGEIITLKQKGPDRPS